MNGEPPKTLTIRFTLPDLDPTQGTGSIQVFTPAEISRRANSFFWKCVGGGFLAIIIPPHVLYPLVGIAAGIIGKKSIQKQRYAFLEGRG